MPPNLKRSDVIPASKRSVIRSLGNSDGHESKDTSNMSHFISRPGVGQLGQSIELVSNHFRVKFDVDKSIYHYDISIESVNESDVGQRHGQRQARVRKLSYAMNREVINACVEDNFTGLFGSHFPVYDGHKNLYTCFPISALSREGTNKRVVVRMGEVRDKERKKIDDGNDGDVNESLVRGTYWVTIKFTRSIISLASMQHYLDNKTNSIPMDAIQALDIVLRQGPTMSKIPIGASLFLKEKDDAFRIKIGGNKQLAFGFYQSLRPCVDGIHLVVDRSCCSFYGGCGVVEMIARMFPFAKDGLMRRSRWSDAERKKIEKEMKGLMIVTTHLSYRKKYTIKGLSYKSANEMYFEIDRGEGREERVSVAQYFKEQYFPLRYAHLPCITVKSGGRSLIYLPLEVCILLSDQSVPNRKLTAQQQAQVIRHCASAQPKERFELIFDAADSIACDEDCTPYLREFGLGVSTAPIDVRGRVLMPPLLMEANGKQCVAKDGKWRMTSGFFCARKLTRWIVVNVGDIEENVIAKCVETLIKSGTLSGMTIEDPLLVLTHDYKMGSIREAVLDMLLNKYGQRSKDDGQEQSGLDCILFLGIENEELYSEIKHLGDCVFGIQTLCVRRNNVYRMNSSMAVNIMLKINTKLGGENVNIHPSSNMWPNILLSNGNTSGVMFIGADVGHPSPAERLSASVSAVVGTMDTSLMKHYATVRVQPRYRDEMIRNLDSMIYELMTQWRTRNGSLPSQIVFYRDGVSEGQFQGVVDTEVHKIKLALRSMSVGYDPALTFVVVQKRHHTRFMPDDHTHGLGRGNNIPPGTTVDTIVTHKHDFDFFLCSHEVVQGTSRPSHYHVLFDENNFRADELQSLTFLLCHTYARCTRSVSIPSVVYYAHLAAARTRTHMAGSTISGSESNSTPSSNQSESSSPVGRLSKQYLPNFNLLSDIIKVHENLKGSMYFV